KFGGNFIEPNCDHRFKRQCFCCIDLTLFARNSACERRGAVRIGASRGYVHRNRSVTCPTPRQSAGRGASPSVAALWSGHLSFGLGFADNFRITRTSTIRERKGSRTVSAVHAPQPTDLRLGRIVRLLMEHATVVVSGTKIAQEITSSRSEVWRLIQQLRRLGVDVAGHPA